MTAFSKSLAGSRPGLGTERPGSAHPDGDVRGSFFWKVAALGSLIAQNHGFSDANKRTALLTMETTLQWNGEYPKWSQETKVIVMKLVGAGHLSLEGLRFALLAACGHNVDQYDDLKDL